MQASDLMGTDIVTIGPESTIREAARAMLSNNVSALPVVDDAEELVGILTHDDFGLHPHYRPLAENLYTLLGASTTPEHLEEVSHRVGHKLVKEVMHRPVITVQADATIAELTALMLREHIHRVPVLRDSKLVGIITRHDFLKLIAGPD
jgi:CBS domain-containing protein